MPVITPHIPEGLIDFMKTFAKSVLKEKPENIYEFATVYFENLLVERDGYLNKGYEKFKKSEKLHEAREKCLLTQIKNFHYRDKKKPQSITITGKDDENGSDDNPEILSPNSLQNKFKPRKLSSKKKSENLLAIKEEEDEENELNIENNHSLKDQYNDAAIIIQKNVRGYITRKALQKQNVQIKEKMEGKESTEEILDKIDIKDNESNIKNIQNTNNNGSENSNNQPNPKEGNAEQNNEKVLQGTITFNSEESNSNDKEKPKEVNSIIETSESEEINDSKKNNKIENPQKAGINDTIQDKTENSRANESVHSVKEISEDMQNDAFQKNENLPLMNEADVATLNTKLEKNSIDSNSLTDTIQSNPEIVPTISNPGTDSMEININRSPVSESIKEKNNGNNKAEDNVGAAEDINATKVSEMNESTNPMEPIFADPILKEAAQNEQNINLSISKPAVKEESASDKAENIEDTNNNATKVSENSGSTFTMETMLTYPILKEAVQNGQKEDISKQKLDLIESPREDVINPLESLSTSPKNSVDVNETYGTQNNEENPKAPEAKDFKENPKSIESKPVKQESNSISTKDEQNIENQSNQSETPEKSEIEREKAIENQDHVKESIVQENPDVILISEKTFLEDKVKSVKEENTNVQQNSENQLKQISKDSENQNEVNSENLTERPNKIEQGEKCETEKKNSMNNQEIVKEAVVQKEPEITDINEKPLVEEAQSSRKEVVNVHGNSENALSKVSKSPQKQIEVNSHNSTGNLNEIEQETKSETEKQNSIMSQEIENQSVVQKESDITDINEKSLVEDALSLEKKVTNVHENNENGLSEISKSPEKENEVNSNNSVENLNKIQQEAIFEIEKDKSIENQNYVKDSIVQEKPDVALIKENPFLEDKENSVKEEVTNVQQNSENQLKQISKNSQKQNEVNSENLTESPNKMEQTAKSETEKQNSINNKEIVKESIVQNETYITDINAKPVVDDAQNSAKEVTNVHENSDNGLSEISKSPQKQSEVKSYSSTENLNKIQQEAKSEIEKETSVQNQNYTKENIIQEEPDVVEIKDDKDNSVKEDISTENEINQISKDSQNENNDYSLDLADSQNKIKQESKQSDELIQSGEITEKVEVSENIPRKSVWYVGSEPIVASNSSTSSTDQISEDSTKKDENIEDQSKSASNDVHLDSPVSAEIESNQEESSSEINVNNEKSKKSGTDNEKLSEKQLSQVKNEISKIHEENAAENTDKEKNINNIQSESEKSEEKSLNLNKEEINQNEKDQSEENEKDDKIQIQNSKNGKKNNDIIEKENKLSDDDTLKEMPSNTLKNEDNNDMLKLGSEDKDENPDSDISNIGNELPVTTNKSEQIKDLNKETAGPKKTNENVELPSEAAMEVGFLTDPNIKQDSEEEVKEEIPLENKKNVKQLEVYPYEVRVYSKSAEKQKDQKNNIVDLQKIEAEIIDYENEMKSVNSVEKELNKQGETQVEKKGLLSDNNSKSDSIKGNEKDQVSRSGSASMKAVEIIDDKKEAPTTNNDNNGKDETTDSDSLEKVQLNISKDTESHEQSELVAENLHNVQKEEKRDEDEERYQNESNDNEKGNHMELKHESEVLPSKLGSKLKEPSDEKPEKSLNNKDKDSSEKMSSAANTDEKITSIHEKDENQSESGNNTEEGKTDDTMKTIDSSNDQVLKNDAKNENLNNLIEKDVKLNEDIELKKKDSADKLNELESDENTKDKETEMEKPPVIDENKVFERKENNSKTDDNKKVNELNTIDDDPVAANTENNSIKSQNEPITSSYNNIKVIETDGIEQNKNVENILNNNDVEINKDSNSDGVEKVITTSEPSETNLQKQDVKQNEITKNVNEELKNDNHLRTTTLEENQTISSKRLETKGNEILQKSIDSNSNLRQSLEDNQKPNKFTEDPSNEAPQLTEEKDEAEDQITKAYLIHQSISKFPSTADLSDVETTRAESRNTINDDLSEIENIDISTYGEDSLEAMYYSLRKNELMLDRMQRRASTERKSASTDRGESFIMNELKKNLSQNSEDDVVIKTMDKTRQNSTIDNKDEEILKNPIEISIKNTEKLIEKLHESKSSPTTATTGLECDSNDEDSKSINRSIRPYSPRIRMESRSPTPISEYPKSVSFESPIDVAQKRSKYFIDHLHAEETIDADILTQAETNNVIRQKMLASSISETDSEAPDEEDQLNTIHDDYNISTALETTSTDTDSTIISAATKIQAGARGFLTRCRLRRASTGTIPSSDSGKKASFGNDAIGESLESLLEENNGTTNIQKSYREYLNRKGNGKSDPVIVRNSSDISTPPKSDSIEDKEVMGITEVKLEQKQAATSPPGGTNNDENHSIDENKAPDDENSTSVTNVTSKSGGACSGSGDDIRSLDDGSHGVTFEGLNLAARRLTLQRGDAVQKDSSPDEENGYLSGGSQLIANNNNNNIQAAKGSKDEETTNSEMINSKASLDKRKSVKKQPWQYFGIRQRTMPVQVDTEIFRLVPKHMRKRIKSAETQKKKCFSVMRKHV